MHLADPETGNLGANAIVGAGIPIALGAALAIRVDGGTRVAVAFFGEGATAQGVLFETLNLASLWKLPLVLVCENNHYVELSPASEVLSAPSLADLGRPFGVVGAEVDGNDVEAVSEAMFTAVARARAGDGPTFLELDTYRQAGHYEGDQMRYRTVEEAQAWALRDPLLLCETRLRELNVDDAVVATIREESTAEMEAAVDWASQQPAAEATSLLEDVYAEPTNSQSTAISSVDRGATSGAER
jgi:TPP-dependent pyruvate/acetoin dehydrogenase alpha subunit